ELRAWAGGTVVVGVAVTPPPPPPPAASATPPPTAARPPTMRMVLPPPPFLLATAGAGVAAADGAGVAWARASARAASNRSITLGGNLSGLRVRSLIWATASRNFAFAAASWPFPMYAMPRYRYACDRSRARDGSAVRRRAAASRVTMA